MKQVRVLVVELASDEARWLDLAECRIWDSVRYLPITMTVQTRPTVADLVHGVNLHPNYLRVANGEA